MGIVGTLSFDIRLGVSVGWLRTKGGSRSWRGAISGGETDLADPELRAGAGNPGLTEPRLVEPG